MRACITLLVALATVLAGCLTPSSPATATAAPTTRDFFLEIVPTDLDMGGATWHAWTFNGQIPGPTLVVNVGDTLRVTVRNNHDLVHSFHTHLVPAGLASDGAQINVITGIGGMAMIPPGGQYTYTLKATEPGINYYHCHSADGGYTISEHMAQGLYGAILVKDPEEPPIRTEVVFMGERGFNVSDPGAPYFLMNGRGLPGGEHTLEEVFAAQGIAGVVAQLNKTVPVMRGRVGERVEIAVVNIGDAVHTFHLHGMTAYSEEQQKGRPVPAQVVQLAPGGVDRIRLTPTDAGLWLFHCHVVSHADQGMIGVFIVDPAEGALELGPAASAATPGHDDPGAPVAHGSSELRIAAGAAGAELAFAPKTLNAAAGSVRIEFDNEGGAVHSLSFPSLGVSSGSVPPGASRAIGFTVQKPGDYEFICAEPGHAGAGMKGTLRIEAAS